MILSILQPQDDHYNQPIAEHNHSYNARQLLAKPRALPPQDDHFYKHSIENYSTYHTSQHRCIFHLSTIFFFHNFFQKRKQEEKEKKTFLKNTKSFWVVLGRNASQPSNNRFGCYWADLCFSNSSYLASEWALVILIIAISM